MGKTSDEQMMLNMFEKLKLNTRDESNQMANKGAYPSDFKSSYTEVAPEGKAINPDEFVKSVPQYTYKSTEKTNHFPPENDYTFKQQSTPYENFNSSWNYNPYDVNSKYSFPNYHSPKYEGAKAYRQPGYEDNYGSYPEQSSSQDPDSYDKYGYDNHGQPSHSDEANQKHEKQQNSPPTTPTPIWIHPFARGGSVFKSKVDDTKKDQSSEQDGSDYNDYDNKEYPSYDYESDNDQDGRYPSYSYPNGNYKRSNDESSEFYPNYSDDSNSYNTRDFKRGDYASSNYPEEDYACDDSYSSRTFPSGSGSRKDYTKDYYQDRDYRNTDSEYSKHEKGYYPSSSRTPKSYRDQPRYSKDSYETDYKPPSYDTDYYQNNKRQDTYRPNEYQTNRKHDPQERQYKRDDRKEKKNEDPYQHAKNRERSNKPTNPDSYYSKNNPGPFATEDSRYPYAKQNNEGDQPGEGPDGGGTHAQYGRKPPSFDSFPFNFMPKHLTGPLFTDTGSTDFQKEAGFGHVANVELDQNGEVQYDYNDNKIAPAQDGTADASKVVNKTGGHKTNESENSISNTMKNSDKHVQSPGSKSGNTQPEGSITKSDNSFLVATERADSAGKTRSKRHTGNYSPHMGMSNQQFSPSLNYNTRSFAPRVGLNTNYSPNTNYGTRNLAPRMGLNTRNLAPNANYNTRGLAPRFGLNTQNHAPNVNYNTRQLAPRFGLNTQRLQPNTNYNTKHLSPKVGLNTRQLAPNANYNTQHMAPKIGVNTRNLSPNMNYNTANLAPKTSAPNPSMKAENLNRLVHSITLDYDINLPLNDGGFADQWHSSSYPRSKGASNQKGYGDNFFKTLKGNDPHNAYYSHDMGNAYGSSSGYKGPGQAKSGHLGYGSKGGQQQENYYMKTPEDIEYPSPLAPFELKKFDLNFDTITPSPKTQKQIFLETIHLGTGGNNDFLDSFSKPKYDFDSNDKWSDDKWSDNKWSDAKWANDKWGSDEKWPEEKWSNDKWSNDKWSNEKWNDDKWSSDKWPSAKWADDKWSSEKWSAEKWPNTKWSSSDDELSRGEKWSNMDSPYSGSLYLDGKLEPKYGMKKAPTSIDTALKGQKKQSSSKWLA